MRKNTIQQIKRYRELETWLEGNYPADNIKDVIELYFLRFFNIPDTEYLISAYKMPRKEFEEALFNYNNGNFLETMNEEQFVDAMAEKYNVTRAEIIRRIQIIIKINKLEKSSSMVKKRKK